MQCRNLFLCET